MKLPFAKLPKVWDAVKFRIINPRPVEYLISWDGPAGRAFNRWVCFVQLRPYSLARPGTVKLLDMGKGINDQFVNQRKDLGDDGLREREFEIECNSKGYHFDRRGWYYVLNDLGTFGSIPVGALLHSETNLFSYNSLMNVARHRVKTSYGNPNTPVRYLDIVSADDPAEPDGLSMKELFDPANAKGERPAVQGPIGPPGTPGVVGAPDPVSEPQKALITVESVNVALYDARLAKAGREVVEPLLKQWFELTGRRAPKWW